MGLFSKSKPEHQGPNFWPCPSYNSGFGKLTDKDTEWMCISKHGFQTETQVWYSILPDGSFLMIQVIWSFLGMLVIPATSQMTFKYYNPNTKQQVWKSVNVGDFKTDGKSCSSDHFNVKNTGSAEGAESYAITANLDKTVTIDVTFARPANAPGFKYGPGEKGGYSYFGYDKEKYEGFVFHRFHPLAISSGHIVLEGEKINCEGDGVFIHAIQSGMRPNLIASRWNFAYFTTGGGREKSELGTVRAIQMEFETTDGYGPTGPNSGRTKVNIGAVYTSASPDSVTLLGVGQTHAPVANVYPVPNSDAVIAEHLHTATDADTGYDAPYGLSFTWAGAPVESNGATKAVVTVEDAWAGLMEKVDVLAEIPYILRKGLAAVTGTKPFIFQYLNEATLNVTVQDKVVPVKGWMFNEASFISM